MVPSWLSFQANDWPKSIKPAPDETQVELRSCEVHQTNTHELWDLASRYSWWPKLVRVTAYVYRFIDNCKAKRQGKHESLLNSHALTASEFNRARTFWIQTAQAAVFESELSKLKLKQAVSTKSCIYSLTPFLDYNSLIRVGGRLEHAQLSFESKHPLLLEDHLISTLIISYTHIVSLHTGVQATLSKIRQQYWILKARSLVKSIIYKCVKCTREKAQVADQIMGQLPNSRVSAPTRAFSHSGIDYAGPVFTRASAGRGITSRKSYIVAVFVCLATCAVHLELVSDYSVHITPTFLNAFQQFCARRGLPEVMYSDNGTTFTGADRELTQAFRDAQCDSNFLNLIASDSITWKFPSHASHFGGLWEAGVRSVKYHLRRVLGSHTLTFEEFTTLCRIEACLNSRPLAPLTDSLEDYETLTPGHFLIGSAITTNPEPYSTPQREQIVSMAVATTNYGTFLEVVANRLY